MASLALGAAGTAFAGPIGGMIGSAIGGIIDNMLMPKKHADGPRLTDLTVTSGSYGQTKPVIYGATRVSGNIIDATQLQEVAHRHGGGKGGPKYSTFTYLATFAVGICEGPITAIWRIWADGMVIYDGRPSLVIQQEGLGNQNGQGGNPNFINYNTAYSQYITIYKGDETQMPNPALEALHGVGNVPAYRGTAYIVGTNFPVSDFGNRVPNFTFEVLGLDNQAISFGVGAGFKSVDLNTFTTVPPTAKSYSPGTDSFGNVILTLEAGIPVVTAVAQDGSIAWTMNSGDFATALHDFTGIFSPSFAGNFTITPVMNGKYLLATLRSIDASSPPAVNAQTGATYLSENWIAVMAPTKTGVPPILGALRAGDTFNVVNNMFQPVMIAGAQTAEDPILFFGQTSSLSVAYNLFVFPPINRFLDGTYALGIPNAPFRSPLQCEHIQLFPFVSTNLMNNLIQMPSASTGLSNTFGGFALPSTTDGTSFMTSIYFYFNRGVMEANAAGGVGTNVEVGTVLAPAFGDGAAIRIDLGQLVWPLGPDASIISALTTTYSIANNQFQDTQGTQVMPFPDEYHYISTGGPGGKDTYAAQPAILQTQADGSILIAFVLKGIDDASTNLSNEEIFTNVRFFSYSPLTQIFTLMGVVSGIAHTAEQVGSPHNPSGFWNDNFSTIYQTGGTFVLGGHSGGAVGGAANLTYWTNIATVNAHGNVTLAAIVRDICLRSGLDDTMFDVTPLETKTVDGYTISHEMAGRSAIEPLQQFFFFDGIESDWIIKWKFRNGGSIGSISEDDLGARADSVSSDVTKVNETRLPDTELPRGIVVKYLLPQIDYQVATQQARRPLPVMHGRNLTTIEAAITMQPEDAKAAAELALYLSWIQRTNYSFNAPRTILQYDVGDVVTLNFTDVENNVTSVPVYIAAMDFGVDELIKVAARRTDTLVYTPAAPASRPLNAGSNGPAVPKAFTFLSDAPLLRDVDDHMGFYALAYGANSTQWIGGQFDKSTDNGATFSTIDLFYLSATVGTVAGKALPAPPTGTGNATWDRVNTVTVILANGALESVTTDQVFAGANYAMVGNELIAFLNATQIAPGVYKLDTLLRGQQGSDWAMGLHTAGEAFYLMANDNSVRSETLQNGERGLPREYRGYSFSQNPTAIPTITFTAQGIRIKPISPVLGRSARSGGDLILAWTPRRRLSPDILDGLDQYIDEPVEAYLLTIYKPGSTTAVARTVTVSTPTFIYTSGMQTADGYAPGGTIHLAVQQISTRVGVGYAFNFTATAAIIASGEFTNEFTTEFD